jgi:hypothetical protein
MGDIPEKVFTRSFLKSVDIVDIITIGGFAVLVGGVWLEFGTPLALIVFGAGVMGLGALAIAGRR